MSLASPGLSRGVPAGTAITSQWPIARATAAKSVPRNRGSQPRSLRRRSPGGWRRSGVNPRSATPALRSPRKAGAREDLFAHQGASILIPAHVDRQVVLTFAVGVIERVGELTQQGQPIAARLGLRKRARPRLRPHCQRVECGARVGDSNRGLAAALATAYVQAQTNRNRASPRAAMGDDVRERLGHAQIEAPQRFRRYAPRGASLAEPGRSTPGFAGIDADRAVHNRIDRVPVVASGASVLSH